jgi:L-ascorbate metabolism protein UlaG (beta-lactamase superfamily)
MSQASAAPSTFCYPHHKEDLVTKEVAAALSSALGVHVVVVAGVHYDHIDKHGIERVMANSRTLTRLILARLESE